MSRFIGVTAGLAGFVAAGQAQIPAFPGAEGFGAYAAGGRGGDVYHVVNLNSSGVGSLAYGVSTVPASGRTIVFDVSGYINISGTLTLNASKVTLAGQTAPGDGVGVKGGTFNISSSDVIIRYFRFRDGYSADALDIDSDSTNTIIDHCDAMMSNDENFSSYSSPPENVTFQWSINAWGMETHSAGGLWDQRHATCHHTLWSHNHTRNPKARPDGLLEWINNVTFDWDIGFIMGDSETPAAWKANVRGCYFVCPPGNLRSVALQYANLDRNGNPNFTLYLDDCAMDANGNGVLDVSLTGYALASGNYATNATPFAGAALPVTRDGPLTAFKKVVSAAGPLRMNADPARPLRDELTAILVSNVVHQVPHHVSSPAGTGAGNGGYGYLNSAPPPVDSDQDGMPDFWENATGSNSGADDHNNAVPGGAFLPAAPAGYTLLEEYLHFLAIPHAILGRTTATNQTSLDVDLGKFTSGFSTPPVVFTVSNVTNLFASLQPDGRTVHLSPPTNFTGRARFDFAVVDGDGSAWTQTLAVIVSSIELPKNLRWRGDGSGNAWNTNSANWVDGAVAATFRTGDHVLFDDTGSNTPALGLVGSLIPGSITVGAARDYALGGTGFLAGTASLEKSGSGKLTLATSNTFSGGTFVREGIVELGTLTAAGSGAVTLDGGALLLNTSGGPATYNNAVSILSPSTLLTPGSGNNNQALGGTMTGSATLGIETPAGGTFSARGNMTAYSGVVTLKSNGVFRFQGSTGSALATFDLGDAGAAIQTRDAATISLGALTGGASAVLRGPGSSASLATYNIGSNGISTVFAGRILDGSFGAGATTAITKLGSGTLTLTGSNAHTGATTVSGGTLLIHGNNGPSPVTAASGGTLGGNGVIGGLTTVNSGGKFAPGDGVGTTTLGGGLTLNSGTLVFDLSNATAAGGGVNDLIQLAGGTLTLNGASTVVPNPVGGMLVNGTYTLIDGGASTVGGVGNLVWGGPSPSRQSFNFDAATAGIVYLQVSGTPAAALVWSGTNGSSWDFSTTNWLNLGSPDRYFNLDAVLFDDRSPNGTVTLAGGIQPGVVVVSNAARVYAFGGAALAGTAGLIKDGPGTLNLGVSNAFSGGVLLKSGSVAANHANALGTGPIRLDGGALATSLSLANNIQALSTGTINVGANINLNVVYTGSGTINLALGPNRLTIAGKANLAGFDGGFNLGASTGNFRLDTAATAAWDAGGVSFNLGTGSALLNNRATVGTTIALGGLAGGPATRLSGSDQAVAAGTTTTYEIGGANLDTLFSGTISDSANQVVTLEKVGAGALTLAGANTYSGGTVVQAGTLRVNNAIGSGTGSGEVQVAAGATLAGNGALDGLVTLADGAALAPGDGVGTLTFNSHLTLSGSTALQFELGTNSDHVVVAADLTLGGTVDVTDAGGFGPGLYTLFSYGSSLSGSLSLGSMPAGFDVRLDSGTPGQVNLIAEAPPVSFNSVSIQGGNLVMGGVGGLPGGSYEVLTATNLALPLASWTRLATNQFFPAGGGFRFTNSIAPGTPRQFYCIGLP